MAEASRLVVVRTVLIQHTVRFHVADIAFGCPFLDVHRLHQFFYEFSVRDFLPASEDFFYDALQLRADVPAQFYSVCNRKYPYLPLLRI